MRELRARYPNVPIVADLKAMDGGGGETELMVKAGASMVVVMGQAHPETVEAAVKAGHDHGAKVMGDNMAMPDPVDGAKRLEDLGCDYIIHHIGYDMRTMRRQRGLDAPTPLDRLRQIVQAVSTPVQAVGGLTIQQAIDTPKFGAPLVVIGAPLVIEGHAFRAATGDMEGMLRMICRKFMPSEKLKWARSSPLEPSMPGLVNYGREPFSVELRELPVPEIGEQDVLLRWAPSAYAAVISPVARIAQLASQLSLRLGS